MMKQIVFVFFYLVLLFTYHANAQVKKIIVETYYVSDNNDSTDVTGGSILISGSKTYHVFVELNSGYKLRKIYGDANHTLKIESTENFYNNTDRPTAYFGYLINQSWFPNNPLLGLDSWLTIGLPTKTNFGVLKSDDTNGSIIGGNNNFGGSASISNGLLVNADSSAGIPLTISDGFITNTSTLGQWIDNGFKDISNVDTTVFGSINTGSSFISNNAYLQQNDGVSAINGNNKILVAQLTTKGKISFELNIEVLDSLGNSINLIAEGVNSSGGDTLVSPILKYPASCGCTDPSYIEYSFNFSCNIIDSCKHKIKFGCTDTMACNFDPDANFNTPLLCCYPGYCNDRDLAVVCPELNNNRFNFSELNLFPDPATELINIHLSTSIKQDFNYTIYDSFGRIIFNKNVELISGSYSELINIQSLTNGIYIVKVNISGIVEYKRFVKQ